MRIGYNIPSNQGVEDPNDLVSLAVLAEKLGCNSVWVSEHLFHSAYIADRLGDRPYHDALTILTAAACATKKVRLGTSVLVLPWHDPPRLGKSVATLDHLSKGRVDLGIGVATTRDEFENLGVDFRTRGRRTDEVLGALQALWTEDVPRFEGEFYRYEGLRFSPKPLQKPYPPILVGGTSKAALRRTARFGDGWHTQRLTPNQVEETVPAIAQLFRDAGRDPAGLRVSIALGLKFVDEASDTPAGERSTLRGTEEEVAETLRAYAAAGVQEAVVTIATADCRAHEESLTRLMREVAPRL